MITCNPQNVSIEQPMFWAIVLGKTSINTFAATWCTLCQREHEILASESGMYCTVLALDQYKARRLVQGQLFATRRHTKQVVNMAVTSGTQRKPHKNQMAANLLPYCRWPPPRIDLKKIFLPFKSLKFSMAYMLSNWVNSLLVWIHFVQYCLHDGREIQDAAIVNASLHSHLSVG